MLFLVATSLAADTYRWKDKDGKTHYGAAVPAEYADQPYDVLNNAGMVIDHVEDTTVSMEAREEEKKKGHERAPLISEEERARQYDRLLIIQYGSIDEIIEAMEVQVAQLGYDKQIIEQSLNSTHKAIREQIKQAADQQRANQPITADQQQAIDHLYTRLAADRKRDDSIQQQEKKIRDRFEKALTRYRFLTTQDQQEDGEATDQG
ncbi:MAG: DUF4124 domain-containing protein [Xanthomonadales bacterium]|nr:DUF4124 domain-containing protein [Xanthomonadales bacterium]